MFTDNRPGREPTGGKEKRSEPDGQEADPLCKRTENIQTVLLSLGKFL